MYIVYILYTYPNNNNKEEEKSDDDGDGSSANAAKAITLNYPFSHVPKIPFQQNLMYIKIYILGVIIIIILSDRKS